MPGYHYRAFPSNSRYVTRLRYTNDPREYWTDSHQTWHLADFEKAIPKMCLLGLHVTVFEGNCSDINCPFSFGWDSADYTEAKLDALKRRWPQLVYHAPARSSLCPLLSDE